MMQLHKVPNGSLIRVISDAEAPPAHRKFKADELLRFSHIDGMYSLCCDKDGKRVHLVAWANVEVMPEDTDWGNSNV